MFTIYVKNFCLKTKCNHLCAEFLFKLDMYKLFFFISLALLLCSNSFSQKGDSSKTVDLFIDCGGCDTDFFRRSLPYTTVVRDRLVADCHVQFFRQRTGGNGWKYELQFFGVDDFETCTDTIRFSVANDATSDDLRQIQLRYLKLGLVPFWIKIGLADKLMLEVDAGEKKEEVKKDKWNNWVFSLNSNVNSNGQAAYSSFSFNNSLSAERVTEKNRIDFGGWYNFSRNKYVFNNEETPEIIFTRQESWSGDLTYTHALGKKFSAGAFTNLGASVFNNYTFYSSIQAAVEYNIFDYEQSNNKQIRFGYRVGPRYNDYVDTTLFDKAEEILYEQSLRMNLKFKQQWGSFNYYVGYFSYLNDLSLYSVNNWLNVNLRLVKGLSFRISGGFNLIRNQINLKKGDASYEDVLLQQQQLSTGYRYWLSSGISYTFGSIYNDVVNPRFGY